MCEYFKKGLTQYEFTNKDVANINELVKDKYSTYNWNIGLSPKGKNRIDVKFGFGIMNITFDLIDGIINNAEIFGDFFASDTLKFVCDKLNGKRFLKEEFNQAFSGIECVIKGATSEEIANKIFE